MLVLQALLKQAAASRTAMTIALTSTRTSVQSLLLGIAWLVVALFLLVTFICPLGIVLARSFGDPLFANYAEMLATGSIRTIVWRTMRLGLIVTTLCAVIGYPSAYAMTRLGDRGRAIAIGVIVLPFLTSYLVRTYGWIAMLGANGIISKVAVSLGFQGGSWNGTLPGLVVAMTHMLLPLMILPIFVAMQAIDERQLLASSSLGAKPAESFVRVYFPQTLSGLFSGIILVFVVSLGFFITPALIGGTSETTVAQLIYSFINELFDWKRSSSLAVSLLLIVIILLAAGSRIINLGAMFGLRDNHVQRRHMRNGASRTGAPTRTIATVASRVPFQGAGHLLSFAFLGLSVALLVLPLVYVIIVSFQPLRLLALPTDGLSLNWYREVLQKWEWFGAAGNSLIVAAMATLIAVVIGFFLASRLRQVSRLTQLGIMLLAIGPLALPNIVLAIGIYGVFLQLGWTGSIWALAVAHGLIALPYAFVNIANGLSGYDQRLDLAASSLGARPWTVLRRVKLPLLQASIVTACALAFLMSFDELIITLFIAGPALPTLPVRMWAATSQNISPELAVVGTLIIIFVLIAGVGLKTANAQRKRLLSTRSADMNSTQEG
ncbi:MAG: ABC transporter permease subunit [Mesorhizobium sp.]|nr:MAG: ABC transporter permease subunit [Mesorhizobium sp.]